MNLIRRFKYYPNFQTDLQDTLTDQTVQIKITRCISMISCTPVQIVNLGIISIISIGQIEIA